MKDLSMLFEDYCVLTFRLEDESKIQCITTLRQDILANYGVRDADGLVDLGERKLIPVGLLDYLVSIEPGYEKSLGPLDTFLESGVKIAWKNA